MSLEVSVRFYRRLKKHIVQQLHVRHDAMSFSRRIVFTVCSYLCQSLHRLLVSHFRSFQGTSPKTQTLSQFSRYATSPSVELFLDGVVVKRKSLVNVFEVAALPLVTGEWWRQQLTEGPNLTRRPEDSPTQVPQRNREMPHRRRGKRDEGFATDVGLHPKLPIAIVRTQCVLKRNGSLQSASCLLHPSVIHALPTFPVLPRRFRLPLPPMTHPNQRQVCCHPTLPRFQQP